MRKILLCLKNVFGGDFISNISLSNRENAKISPFKVLHQSSQVRALSIWVSLHQRERLLSEILDFYRACTKHHIYPTVLTVSDGVNGTCFVNEENNFISNQALHLCWCSSLNFCSSLQILH